MIVTIGINTYTMSKQLAMNLVKTAKASVNENIIIGLEKGDTLEMRRDKFASRSLLRAQVKEFKKQGFKVHWRSKGNER